jgi:hypothetical protein
VSSQWRRELGLILAWLAFPLIPAILEALYYRVCTFEIFRSARLGPDPHDWDWLIWVLMLGPLVGYSFLAGATVDLPDDLEAPRRGLRRLLARRSVWIAIGPWWGFLACTGIYMGYSFLWSNFEALQCFSVQLPESWRGGWAETILGWGFMVAVVGTLAYGWLWPAAAAILRGARLGRAGRAVYRGLVGSLAFVGSLFGSFWAITSSLRTYFFDPTVMPLILLALCLAVLSGCAGPITYGEMRRRELFHAMLVAWILGLAFVWRWWSRRRPGPPRNGTAALGGSS